MYFFSRIFPVLILLCTFYKMVRDCAILKVFSHIRKLCRIFENCWLSRKRHQIYVDTTYTCWVIQDPLGFSSFLLENPNGSCITRANTIGLKLVKDWQQSQKLLNSVTRKCSTRCLWLKLRLMKLNKCSLSVSSLKLARSFCNSFEKRPFYFSK